MALIPVIFFSNSGDCSTIYLQDITGQYSSQNTGGYGSPNTALTAVTGVTISGTYYAPDGTTQALPILPVVSPLSIFPTVANPSPLTLNEVYTLTPTMLGFNTTSFPDGIYSLVYTVTDGTSFFPSVATQYLFDCNSWCCINNAMSSVDPCDCGCDDNNRDVFFYRDNLLAAESAVGCFKNGEGLSLLNSVVSWCSKSGCGCNQ